MLHYATILYIMLHYATLWVGAMFHLEHVSPFSDEYGYEDPWYKVTKIFQETLFAAAAIATTNTTEQMTVAKSAKAEDLSKIRWIVVIILCLLAKLKFEKNNWFQNHFKANIKV